MTDRTLRLGLLDQILAALLDGPATADVICARIGGYGSGPHLRRLHPDDLVDVLDGLSLAQAIAGRVDVEMCDVEWTRLLPVAAVISI